MSRYKGRMSEAMFDQTWPFQVPLKASHVRAFREAVKADAARLGMDAPRTPHLTIDDEWHECFCFSTMEAAQSFASEYGAEVKDARKRINKGTWQIWEEAKTAEGKGG